MASTDPDHDKSADSTRSSKRSSSQHLLPVPRRSTRHTRLHPEVDDITTQQADNVGANATNTETDDASKQQPQADDASKQHPQADDANKQCNGNMHEAVTDETSNDSTLDQAAAAISQACKYEEINGKKYHKVMRRERFKRSTAASRSKVVWRRNKRRQFHMVTYYVDEQGNEFTQKELFGDNDPEAQIVAVTEHIIDMGGASSHSKQQPVTTNIIPNGLCDESSNDASVKSDDVAKMENDAKLDCSKESSTAAQTDSNTESITLSTLTPDTDTKVSSLTIDTTVVDEEKENQPSPCSQSSPRQRRHSLSPRAAHSSPMRSHCSPKSQCSPVSQVSQRSPASRASVRTASPGSAGDALAVSSQSPPRSSNNASPRSPRSMCTQSPRSMHSQSPRSMRSQSPRSMRSQSPRSRSKSPRNLFSSATSGAKTEATSLDSTREYTAATVNTEPSSRMSSPNKHSPAAESAENMSSSVSGYKHSANDRAEIDAQQDNDVTEVTLY